LNFNLKKTEMNKTRSGKTQSLQFGIWGEITDLDQEDFFLEGEVAFLVNNESDDDVTLDVVNADGVLIEYVRFRPGYDPRHIIRIKQNTGLPPDIKLYWGN